jgi:hypothetical protein
MMCGPRPYYQQSHMHRNILEWNGTILPSNKLHIMLQIKESHMLFAGKKRERESIKTTFRKYISTAKKG